LTLLAKKFTSVIAPEGPLKLLKPGWNYELPTAAWSGHSASTSLARK
jgi:hypothetical protein